MINLFFVANDSKRVVSEKIDNLANELRVENKAISLEERHYQNQRRSESPPGISKRISTQVITEDRTNNNSIISGSVDTETNIRRVDNSDNISQATFTEIRRAESSGSFVSSGT